MRGESAVVVEEQAEARPAGCCEVLACECRRWFGTVFVYFERVVREPFKNYLANFVH